MNINLFWRGALIGLAIAAPVGPIGLLCIQRTLQDGRRYGLVSGLGAAAADAVYGFMAAFGLTVISTFLLEQQAWLRAGGGLFLLFLGLRTFLATPAVQAAQGSRGGLPAAFGSTFLLTLTNPLTVLSFLGIFAGLGLVAEGDDYLAPALLVAGVFAGSASWWLLLSGGVSLLRDRFDERVRRWVNRLAGVIIAGFGLFTLIGLWWQ